MPVTSLQPSVRHFGSRPMPGGERPESRWPRSGRRRARRCALWLLVLALGAFPCPAALREPVHPRRNVEEFPPVEASFIRFIVRATNRGEPCLDELEVYAADGRAVNVALAAQGARATASGSLLGFAIHQLEGVNDGRYGNARSWIADRIEGAWVQIELPQPTRIHKVVWGRDREGNFLDRLATEYRIDVATDTNHWRTVASSADREPLPVGALSITGDSLTRPLANRFAPVSTTLSADPGPSPGEHRIDVWQTAAGLPGNTVTAIEQTRDGYLWIGTLNGLARFDGVRFRVFGEESALPALRISSLLAARDGTLWIGTEGGGLAQHRDGVFRAWSRTNGLASDTVTALAEDATGRLWVGTAAGLQAWRQGRFLSESELALGGNARRPVMAVCVDARDVLWVVTANQLMTRTEGQPLRRPTTAEPSSFSSVLAATAGRSGQVWFGGANGYLGALSNGVVQLVREQPGQLLEAVWSLCETRSGDVWAGTANGGLRRWRAGRFQSLTTQEGLSDNSVRCLLEDREGNLWVGTVGGGLNRVKARTLRTFTTRDGLAHNVTMSLAEDARGDVWIGSNCGGLTVRRQGVFAVYAANYLLDNECIWSLLPGAEDALWVGTWGGGLFRLHGREVRHQPVARAGNDDPVIALADDGQGGLWLGTMQGGVKSLRDGRLEDALPAGVQPRHPVTCLLREPGGLWWVGTAGGGLLAWSGGDRVVVWTRREGLPSNSIRTLHRDAQGVLWIGTGGGLGRLVDGKLTAFTRAQGMPDDVISQILPDDLGHLWFGSNQGIFRVARRDFEDVAAGRATRVNAIAYGRAEGMESLECTGGFHPAGLRTRDGTLWFSTVKGLVMVEPGRIPTNPLPPPVRIEEMIVDGQPRPADAAVTTPDAVRLGPGVQRLEFQFTALSLVAPERNRFQYRLEGLERAWVDAGGQRVAAYPALRPGRYQFRVKACNNDGVWNEEGATLAFVVRPFFWQTWWFAGGILALVLGAGAWTVRTMAVRRLRRKLRRLEELNAVEQERTRIARDIHDELGATLTRITLLTEVGRRHREQPDEVGADLARISATAREAVRAMDAIVWAVNPRNDSLDHFANYLSQFAEEFLRPTAIRCRLDIPADLPEQAMSTEARHQLFLIVKEALNNVVRHAGASEVWLRLRMENGELILTLADNGHGITGSAPEGAGHEGLRNIRQRLAQLGGRLDLRSDAASGTSLCLHLPLPAAERGPTP